MNKKLLWKILRVVISIVLIAFVLSTITFVDQHVKGIVKEKTPDYLKLESGERLLKEEVSLLPGMKYSSIKVGDYAEGIKTGFFTIIKHIDKNLFIIGLVVFGLGNFIIAIRWKILLAVQGVKLRYPESANLTFVGNFFNNFSLGLNGGDVVKAYFVAKKTHKKTEAISTVFFDRVLGVSSMGIIAMVMVTVNLHQKGMAEVAGYLYGFVALVLIVGIIFFSRRIRKLVRFNLLLEKLPFNKIVRKVDKAFFMYRYNKRKVLVGFLLTLVSQSCLFLGCYLFGLALGMGKLSVIYFFAYVPIILIICAIPVTIGGWGLREVVFKRFFMPVGVPAEIAISISILYGLSQILWSLPGGILFALYRDKHTPEQMEQELEKDDIPDNAFSS